MIKNQLLEYIFQDWEVNKQTSLKSRVVLSSFRTSQLLLNLPYPFRLITYLYQIFTEILFSIELPANTKIGKNLQLQHGFSLVINRHVTIGKDCIIRHSTTIGNKILSDGSVSSSPIIGDHVEIGCNVVILGPIEIGDNAVIGAGAVVVSDVPAHAVVAGNPAKVIRLNRFQSSLSCVGR
ncbi:serine acetyltransferase [Acaryochloris sp. CCMEE 5410]|uniref:serine acetyltransferase n=1 Tax=Acaryochloris sp. CCMEE 5410 TaxID=310037 RepID=UPI0002483B93|nr:DapH/DapD/GlmU-related protein [Acaryochloris sp. CCMEE 5410]KAI9132422.1 serine acetyltransferase [Acaryochloris sp. CCMEE 5410]